MEFLNLNTGKKGQKSIPKDKGEMDPFYRYWRHILARIMPDS